MSDAASFNDEFVILINRCAVLHTTSSLSEDFNRAWDLIRDRELDYDWKNQEGVSILGAVLGAFLDNKTKVDLFAGMIDHGLNPLLCCDHDLQSVVNNSSIWSMLVERAALQEDQSLPMRDAQGGNLYYARARFNPGGMGDTLEQLLLRRQIEQKGETHLPWKWKLNWATQAKEDGSTLLHYLWSDAIQAHDVALYQDENAGWPEHYGIDASTIARLLLTHQLVELGCDLLQTNQTGIRAWELMMARDFSRINDPEVVEKFEALRVDAEDRLLALNTPQAPRDHKPGVRL